MKDDRLYLVHISECIARIKQYTAGGKDEFLIDTKTQDAVLRNLQILAESTQQLSLALKANHAEVDWRKIARLRNILVHEYFGVNIARVWEIIEHSLNDLNVQVEKLLKSLEEAP